MEPKINYHYRVKFKEVDEFNWNCKPINVTTYEPRIMPKIDRILTTLRKPYNNRQAVIVVNGEEKDNSCLISIQFQNIDNELIVIANYRSQCKINGRPNDSRMLQYVSTIVMRNLGLKRYSIFVNVGNYHINPDIK